MALDILSNGQHILVLSLEPKSESEGSLARASVRNKLRLIAPFVRIDASADPFKSVHWSADGGGAIHTSWVRHDGKGGTAVNREIVPCKCVEVDGQTH